MTRDQYNNMAWLPQGEQAAMLAEERAAFGDEGINAGMTSVFDRGPNGKMQFDDEVDNPNSNVEKTETITTNADGTKTKTIKENKQNTPAFQGKAEQVANGGVMKEDQANYTPTQNGNFVQQGQASGANTDYFGNEIATDFAGQEQPYMNDANTRAAQMNRNLGFDDAWGDSGATPYEMPQSIGQSYGGGALQSRDPRHAAEVARYREQVQANQLAAGQGMIGGGLLDPNAGVAPQIGMDNRPQVMNPRAAAVAQNQEVQRVNAATDQAVAAGVITPEEGAAEKQVAAATMSQESTQQGHGTEYNSAARDLNTVEHQAQQQQSVIDNAVASGTIAPEAAQIETQKNQAKVTEAKSVFDGITSGLQGFGDSITDAVGNVAGSIEAAGQSLTDSVAGGADAASEAVSNMDNEQVDSIIGKAGAVGQNMLDGIKGLVDSGGDPSANFDKIKEWYKDNPVMAQALIGAGVNYMKTGNIYSAASAGVGAAASQFSAQEAGKANTAAAAQKRANDMQDFKIKESYKAAVKAGAAVSPADTNKANQAYAKSFATEFSAKLPKDFKSQHATAFNSGQVRKAMGMIKSKYGIDMATANNTDTAAFYQAGEDLLEDNNRLIAMGKSPKKDLTQYVERNVIRSAATGAGVPVDAFRRPDGSSVRPEMMKQAMGNISMAAKKRGRTNDQMWGDIYSYYNGLSQSQKDAYASSANDKGMSPFTYFMQHEINMDK